MALLILVKLCVNLLLLNGVDCEFFSSLGQMKDLVNADKELLKPLRDFIDAEVEKIDTIRKFANEVESTIAHITTDVENYLIHPVNQYHLVKRLAYQWSHVMEIISDPIHKDLQGELALKKKSFPTDEDLQGSIEALLRLQSTYSLDAQQLISGDVKGYRSHRPMVAEDSYRIGQVAYYLNDNHRCVEWMNATAGMDEETYPKYFTKFDVLDHLSYCLVQQGNAKEALEVSKQMLTIDPYEERIQENVEKLRDLLKSNETIKQTAATNPHLSDYEELCRQEKQIPADVEKKLRCYYWTNHKSPKLLLKPIKLEELWPSPHLVRFYDIISDDEIEDIKFLSKFALSRATVHNPATGKLEHAHYRVSKSAWLHGSHHPTIARVDRRIADVTGLSMKTAEHLQIANYGIGGQYEPHFDFHRTTDFGKVDGNIGNRIATFLLYLSDVDYGGSTVFLHPGVAVKPIKRSAVFWYNLFPSGAGDLRTRHAACPVLIGNKWVSNKWIHEIGQEFHRKCGLSRQSDNRVF